MSRIFNVKLMSDDFLCMMPYLKMQFPSSSQLLMVPLCCFVLWVQTHLVVTRKLTLSLLNISEGVVYAMKKLVNHGCICDYAYNMGDAPAELSRKISGIAGICEISRRQQCSLFSAKHSFSIYWLRGKKLGTDLVSEKWNRIKAIRMEFIMMMAQLAESLHTI